MLPPQGRKDPDPDGAAASRSTQPDFEACGPDLGHHRPATVEAASTISTPQLSSPKLPGRLSEHALAMRSRPLGQKGTLDHRAESKDDLDGPPHSR
ncbi:hypothetical protein NDU88_005999 [Pleurodeles waltl]|uniref:Uncharacterized protein n=1 Tax=Pleurodeles waltl TaxID=8319 RepID=A0AAV7WWB5_PLEWA|nr:hypothetical protein NDU88_005999 [Pleurodeles waltl]